MRSAPKDYSDPTQYLWTDLPDASQHLAQRAPKLRTSRAALEQFITEGYAILPGAVDPDAIDRMKSDIYDRIVPGLDPTPMTYWDDDGHHYGTVEAALLEKREAKILDLHNRIDSATQVALAPRITDFLADVFDDDVVSFQSLYFHNGSQQTAHQDTAFVYTVPAMHFVASWIALEDIRPDTGELFYYPRSQRLDDFIFDKSGGKALLPDEGIGGQYSINLEAACRAAGLAKATFVPKKGDVLFWAADLVHGGSPRLTAATRRSFVNHYCPKSASVPYAKLRERTPRRATDVGWVVADY